MAKGAEASDSIENLTAEQIIDAMADICMPYGQREVGEIDAAQFAKRKGISICAARGRLNRAAERGAIESRMVYERGKIISVYRLR